MKEVIPYVKMYTIPLCIVFLLGISSRGVDGLFCYKCISIDCNYEDLECQRIQSFLQYELRNLYYFNDYLPFCPGLNETEKWRRIQIEDEPCRQEKSNDATCTLGRMQIKTTETNADHRSKQRVNYATVMGCANRNLLNRIKEAFSDGNCDMLHQNSSTSVNIFRELQLEHCRELSSMCYQKDYCVNFTSSVVKPWADHKEESKRFEYTLILGMFGVVVVVITALLIAGMCKDPPSRPSNLPRSIGDESETVKVLEVRDKDFCSIESEVVPNLSKNGTLGSIRRPSSKPPPPPPRLNRQQRESTPV
ncbi:hypothetical protein Ocin01_19245 [Orchesella cincta]|uniref:Uncharacterized protein n=1 Tax=Orchesella cincta TaxID=48709 RepID=A0A1D2M386_ORCCI|nr:hypothetical protein Ocin01_19245 [Orchesella cincta]